MTNQENIKIIKKLFELYNRNDPKNLDSFDEILASNLQLHDPAAPKNIKAGPQALKQAEAAYIRAFPNKVTTIDNIIAADNQVVVRWTAKGTQRGEFEGVAPSNREFKISGISIFTIAHNKITDIWQIWDHLGLLEQIGEIRQTYAVR